jgi:hypothetical protein
MPYTRMKREEISEFFERVVLDGTVDEEGVGSHWCEYGCVAGEGDSPGVSVTEDVFGDGEVDGGECVDEDCVRVCAFGIGG